MSDGHNPDTIAESGINDLKDFLQRCWKLAGMPRFDQLMEESISAFLAENPALPEHHQDFFIAALNAAKRERDWRQNGQEHEQQFKVRDEQDRHPTPALDEIA